MSPHPNPLLKEREEVLMDIFPLPMEEGKGEGFNIFINIIIHCNYVLYKLNLTAMTLTLFSQSYTKTADVSISFSLNHLLNSIFKNK